jgi:hypothetical protein
MPVNSGARCLGTVFWFCCIPTSKSFSDDARTAAKLIESAYFVAFSLDTLGRRIGVTHERCKTCEGSQDPGHAIVQLVRPTLLPLSVLKIWHLADGKIEMIQRSHGERQNEEDELKVL